jgi:flagellar hook protein FlgE
MINAINSALTALQAFGTKQEVTSNNVANVNTDGFKKSRATFQEADPSGVIVSISRVNTPGGPLPPDENTGEPREASNVDIGEEVVNQTTTKFAYTANLKTLKTTNDMIGTVIDILDK